ncbi:hypothetical protein FHX11_004935 [Rhizobium sp. BK602]|nr:hypothetical protein [Rhizobium sp. BK602]
MGGKSAAMPARCGRHAGIRKITDFNDYLQAPDEPIAVCGVSCPRKCRETGLVVFKAATFHGITLVMDNEHAMRSALECEVANALAVAGGLDASDVTVTAVGQEIRLGGTVATPDEVKRASAVAEAMPGVRLVRNRITVG